MLQNFDPHNAIVYTNRATAFKKHKDFNLMLQDSQQALELDPAYFKAYLRNGEALVELGKLDSERDVSLIDRGIKHLQKALYYCWKLKVTDQNY